MDHLNYHPPSQQASMLQHQAPAPVNRNAPIPGAQTEGMGLYNDTPTHHADGDLGGAYAHGAAPAAAGAAAGVHPAYRDEYSGYQSPHNHAEGYVSPPAHDAYSAPQGAASSYYQQATSPPPPSYHNAPSAHSGYGVASPVSNSGLPSALTPGGGIQPAHQAHGQDTGTTGSYNAYH